MDRGWFTRLAIVLIIGLGAIWFLTPSYYSFFKMDRKDRNNVKLLENKLPVWSPPARYRLALGLDLQGGINMVLRVDTKTALEKRADRFGQEMVRHVSDKKLGEVTSD